MSCLEAQLTCPKSEYPERDCPESKLPCDKVRAEMTEASGFECPDYTPVLPSPEYVEAKKKYLDAFGKRSKACKRNVGGYYSSACLESKLKECAIRISYIDSRKSCLESESNVTDHS